MDPRRNHLPSINTEKMSKTTLTELLGLGVGVMQEWGAIVRWTEQNPPPPIRGYMPTTMSW